MIWLLNNWKWLTAITLAVGIFFAGYSKGADSVKRDWQRERYEMVKAQLEAVEQNQRTITELEEKHAKATTDLDYLRAHPVGRVRLPKTTCPDLPSPPSGVAIPATSPERTSDAAQDALGEAQSGMESDAIEWARALNACQVVMDWAKSLKTGTR